MSKFPLPKDWREVRLGSLGMLFRGRGGTRSDESDNGLPCIRYGDIYTHHDYIVETFCSAINPSSAFLYSPLHSGDVVFAGSGETFEEIGKATAYCGEEKAYAGGDTIILRPDSRLNSYFAGYAVNSSSAVRQKSRLGQGSSVIHISTEHLASISLQLPPIHQQEKIAQILQTIDRAITHTKALIEKYQQIKAGLMHDLFTRGIGANGKLRPPREEAPELYQESAIGWIPKEWKVDSLKNTFGSKNIVNGPFGSDLLTSELKDEGIPVLYCQDVKPEAFIRVSSSHVTPIKAAQLYFCSVRRGDILLSKVGTPPCDSCVYEETLDAVVTQDVIRIRPLADQDPYFFSSWFNSGFGRKAIRRIAIEGTRERVSLGDFKALLVASPCRLEQREIGKRIYQIQIVITKEKLNLEKHYKQKQGLVHDLLTGKVPVKVDPDEVGL